MAHETMTPIGRVRRGLALALETGAALAFMVMVVSLILQIAFRYALGVVAPWTEELARFACIWAVFLGAAVCFDEQAHIRIDFVIGKLEGSVTRRILLLINIFVTGTFILIAFYGSILLLRVGWADTATTVPIQMG